MNLTLEEYLKQAVIEKRKVRMRERRKVIRELREFVNGKLKYYNEVINDPNFVHDESGHWDTGNRHAYKSMLEELEEMGK